MRNDEKSLKEGVREAQERPASERLHEETPEQPGKPDAVNLERKEPVTTAARRRDAF